MSRKRLAACLIVAGVIGGSAAPALATEDDNSYICLVATNDRNNPGPPAVCVWVPVGTTGPQ